MGQGKEIYAALFDEEDVRASGFIGISLGETSGRTLAYTLPIILSAIARCFRVSFVAVSSSNTLSQTSRSTLSTSSLDPRQIACKPYYQNRKKDE